MRGRLIAACARGALRSSSRLSLRRAQALGALAGRIAWVARSDAARVTLINLQACFPDLQPPAIETLARASLAATGRLSAEMGAVWCWPEHRWQRLVASVRGDDALAECQRDNRGAIILAPHIGNWEVLNLFLGRRFGITAMYDPPRIAELDPVVRDARMRAGSRLVPTNAAGIRALHRTLAGGGIVGLLPDQVPARKAGVYAPFFGRPALTMTLAGRMMRRWRPSAFIGTALRLEHGAGFDIDIEPLPYVPEDDDVALAAAINAAVERVVRHRPDQYQWEYKRFKRPPEGSEKLY
jgi:Kdo2-lipid IVA lauroyltransferase/acyltransferase